MKAYQIFLETKQDEALAARAKKEGLTNLNYLRVLISRDLGFELERKSLGRPPALQPLWCTRVPLDQGGRVTGRFWTRAEAMEKKKKAETVMLLADDLEGYDVDYDTDPRGSVGSVDV